MEGLEHIRRLWRHAAWADAAMLDTLRSTADLPDAVLREYAHILGAEETWLSRLEGRVARAAVWPTITLDEAESLGRLLRRDYDAYLAGLTEGDLARDVSYTNSAGVPFQTPAGDILLHVALHGQYHRGKVNVLLRRAGAVPRPVDYIAFVRGVPAATQPAHSSDGSG
ncbi:MAG TPA: DinB family protein [Gemmatimonadaceae bacterium]|nr:DinB family protein [Gemmatimonadaceae bacterium]